MLEGEGLVVLWGTTFVGYLVFWAVWSRWDLMLAKPDKPTLSEAAKWAVVEKRFNRRSLIWSAGLVAYLIAWSVFTDHP